MKRPALLRPVLALALTVPLLLTGCSDGNATSGESNTDNQVEQPPLPDEGDGEQGDDTDTQDDGEEDTESS